MNPMSEKENTIEFESQTRMSPTDLWLFRKFKNNFKMRLKVKNIKS